MTLLFSPIISFAQINCMAVQTLGNASREYLIEEVNQEVEQTSYRISRKLYFKIKNIQNLNFYGCKIKIDLNFYLKKPSRTLNGVAQVIAKVDEFNGRKVCFKNPKVSTMDIINRGRLLESFYKFIANIVLPPKTCFHI
ncbi:MAG: hypothetical protein ACO20H_08845 [Bacteriovoracaceae bacterium]